MFSPLTLIKPAVLSIAVLFASQFTHANSFQNSSFEPSSPASSAVLILSTALDDLGALKDKKTSKSIKDFINTKIVPHLSIETSAKFALKDHWDKFNDFEKKTFSRYIERSLSRDYVSFLSSYNSENGVLIKANSPAKIQNNKAIVPITVLINGSSRPISITLRMVNDGSWKIYDVIYKGVSLAKNYRLEFNSHIRRKGVPSLIKKINKKLLSITVSF